MCKMDVSMVKGTIKGVKGGLFLLVGMNGNFKAPVTSAVTTRTRRFKVTSFNS